MILNLRTKSLEFNDAEWEVIRWLNSVRPRKFESFVIGYLSSRSFNMKSQRARELVKKLAESPEELKKLEDSLG